MPKVIEKIVNPKYKHQHLLNKALELAEQGKMLEAVISLYKSSLSGSAAIEDLYQKKAIINVLPINSDIKATNDSQQFALGLCYVSGFGVPQSDTKAEEYFNYAASQNIVEARICLAQMYIDGRAGLELPDQVARNNQVAQWFEKAPFIDNAEAQNILGYMYEAGLMGLGLPELERKKKATEWYTKAALQGCIRAQCSLAFMYFEKLTGLELHEDESVEQAAQWFKKAGLQGYEFAQTNLGCMYEARLTGHELTEKERNQKAKEWYERAALQGDAIAQNYLGLLYANKKITANLSFAECNIQAAQWYEKAALQNNSAAQNNLGCMYYYGLIGLDLTEVARNKKAAYWFRCAAVDQDSKARDNLERMESLDDMDTSYIKKYHLAIIDKKYKELASALLHDHGWDLFQEFDRETLDSDEQLKEIFLEVSKELSQTEVVNLNEKCIRYELKTKLYCLGAIKITDDKDIDFTMLSESTREQYIIKLFNTYIERDEESSQAQAILLSLYDNHKGLVAENMCTLIACVAINSLGDEYESTPNISQLSKDEMSSIVFLAHLDKGSDFFEFQYQFITSKLLAKEFIKLIDCSSQNLLPVKPIDEDDDEFKRQRRNYMEFLFTNKHLKCFEDIFSTEKDKVFTLKTLSGLRLSKDNFINKIKIAATSQSRKSQLQTSRVVSFSRGINTPATAAKSIEVELNKLLTMPSSSTGIRMRI